MTVDRVRTVDRVIVVGGGIGGLSLALGLQRRGIAVSVYERASELREIGAGIILQPNGRNGLVDLGVDAAVEAVSSCPIVFHGCDYATGEVLTSTPSARVAENFGLPALAVHRADLHSAILAAVRANDPHAVQAAHEFVSLDQDEGGVTVRFANGATDRACLVVGADGNGSAVRSFVFGSERATFNGQVAFRAVLPIDDVPAIVRERELAMHRGPDRYLLYYSLRGGKLMNLIGCGRTDEWEEEGWSIPATAAQFLDAYSDFAPHLLDLIIAVPDDDLFKWGLYDREPLETWTSGRVAMLGDAAHPMTPFLGQGASMAIEDAVVLARAIEGSDSVATALKRYEAARVERGNNVARWSWEEGKALQNPAIKNKGAVGYGLLTYDPAAVPV
ncbi:MAG: FAD-dependent monooxygenase [Acidimicrobiales bacterium]